MRITIAARTKENKDLRTNLMTKWEYKTIRLELSKGTWLAGGRIDEGQLNSMLNELGSQGWELVVALDTNFFGGQTRDSFVVLKRPSQ